MTSKFLILGSGPVFEQAQQIAAGLPGHDIQAIEIFAPDRFNFQAPDLGAYPPTDWGLFVALDDRALNMTRHQFVAWVKGQGYRLHKLVAPDAFVSPSVTLGENTMIQKGAIIGAETKLGLNVVVGPGVRVGERCRIGSGSYLDAGSVVGRESELGDFVTVGMGAVVKDGSKVGRSSELRQPITYGGAIPDRTFYIDTFQNAVSIISPF